MKTTTVATITIAKESREFNLTVDFDGATQEDFVAWSLRTLVIGWQNEHRTANKGVGQWPTEKDVTIKATDRRIGVRRAAVVDPVKLITSFSAEELAKYAKLIADLQKAKPAQK